ncbi:ribulose-1,5 bisphosphate carboxylase/oxygenase large subunit N-methyltransferase, chloroplastic [Andrographis paniculata]|uniref:ribulose-1,5 bisphosphate carboxylase/oxygenase large subunit N-methyltransferase, chloroplastic n=1 Tax=Andrographis paniculata TaxID=175694 RepID=UPI0021E88B44|nr:ribulose-1,5 bisphosphate carboxylase/oxygenase large subunit N-methyltransferase, chloroplastic [Andrographis paniculata]
MLLHSGISANRWWAPIRKPILSALFYCSSVSSDQLNSVSSLKSLDEDCIDFLPWLEHKAGSEISSVLSIGKSCHGRTLHASKQIQPGECLLKVPYTVQLSPENLRSEVASLLGDEIGNVAKVAILILQEKRLGRSSEWAPYISRLPRRNDLHSTIFWSDDELEMIRPSALYKETLRQKAEIENNFKNVKQAVDQVPDLFKTMTIEEFSYAYGLVTSRAWESSKGVSLIPFADFLNHDGDSEAYVLSNESKLHSEVIADQEIARGDEVMIRYGKFSNATLLLDFGFTVSCNKYDQARLELTIPEHDALYAQKLELLDNHRTRTPNDVNEFSGLLNSFTIKEVRRGSKKGKGIPQSLRAFARVMTCDSEEELIVLARQAAKCDGRLARHPLGDKNREVSAHQFLLSEIQRLIEVHSKYVEPLMDAPPYLLRRRLARDLLSGELRVLKSASSWLESYCSTLCR